MQTGRVWLVCLSTFVLGARPVGAQSPAQPFDVLPPKPEGRITRSPETAESPSGAVVGDLPVEVPSPWPPASLGGVPPGSWQAGPQSVWEWQLLPEGLLFKSYLAGERESRFASAWLYESDRGWVWDVTLGGRVGIVRYGSVFVAPPEGWQLDIEGAAFPRLDPEEDGDLESADFRFGIPLTWARGPYEAKFAYYHLSSHAGDEFLQRNPGFTRINYVRDALVLAGGYYPTEDIRLYAEAAWAFNADGGAEPWEFQFGAEYSPALPTRIHGAPFFAINGHLREEVDFGGSVNMMAGWQWRGAGTGRLFRAGLQYFNGKTSQYEFFREHEELIGLGLWYDY